MRLPRIVRTVTFKLALTQAALFGVSAAVLFAAVYWSMVAYATTQLREAIEAEAAVLAEERSTDGLSELCKTIDLRSRGRQPEGRVYLLRAPDGRVLAGALRAGDLIFGWREFRPEAGTGPLDDEPTSVMAFAQALPSGETLIVGRDMRDVDDVGEKLVHTFGWAAGVTLMLAILGGVVSSLAALRRVEAINAITRRIMEGDLNRRVPLRGSGDEFDRLAANLNEMLDRIQMLMEGLRQVSNDIAHDLRTPLTHLRQRLEGTLQGPRSVQAYETALEATTADTDAILKMFAALLRIAQIEAGTRRSGFGDVDLSSVFTAMLDTYAPVAEDNHQRLAGAIQPGLHVSGDRELIMQMLANLIENAIRHAGQGALIRLELRMGEAAPIGCVSDTGTGIPAELRQKVFRRFVRLEPSRPSEGNGLGLSLVKAVADLHGVGVVLVDNAPGLRVDLKFPAASEVPACHGRRPDQE